MMKRVSLGIILPGDPKCQQKKKLWLTILTFLSKYAWILFAILCIIAIVLGFISDDHYFAIALKFAVLTAFFGICAAFWTKHYRCPYCGHFFAIKQISEEVLVDTYSSTFTRTEYNTHSGMAWNFNGDVAFYDGTTSRKVQGKDVTEVYVCNKRCGACGCVNKVKIKRWHRE